MSSERLPERHEIQFLIRRLVETSFLCVNADGLEFIQFSRNHDLRGGDFPADATRQDVIVPTTTEGLLDKAGLTKCAILLDPSVPSPSSPEGISTVGLHTSPIAF